MKVFTLEKNGRTARIVWRYGKGKIKFRINDTWGDFMYHLDGTDSPVPADRTVELGNSPALICGKDYL